MPRKSTKHNTSVGVKFFLQDDTSRKQLKGVESVSPSFDEIEWGTEDSFDLETGETIQKKTVKNAKEFTVTMKDIDQSENEGFAMAKLYAEEEGDAERVYLIAQTAENEEVAVLGCIKSLTGGDYNNALRKPTFVIAGNPCTPPSNPGA